MNTSLREGMPYLVSIGRVVCSPLRVTREPAGTAPRITQPAPMRILLCERMIKKRPIEIKGVSGERIPLGKITVSSIVLMLLWSPYLYVYYPGFIFGDSTANIAQALGQQPLTNHHPVAYVLFIRLCLRLGQHLGGLTMGLAIYSVIQMGIMALGIGLMVQWASGMGYHDSL